MRHKQACIACGGFDSSHKTAWLDTTLVVMAHKLGDTTISSAAARLVERGIGSVVRYGWPILRLAGKKVGFITYDESPASIEDSRAEAVWNEAKRRNIDIRRVHVGGRPTNLFEVRVHGRWHLFSLYPFPSRYQHRKTWTDDKFLFKQHALRNGITVPVPYSVSTFAQAKKAMQELGVVCVKPRNGSNGRHTFPHVSTETELKEAFYSAKQLCHWVIVEKNLEGKLARATCVGGQMVGFLECELPTVVGDGHSTVEALIAERNATRGPHVQPIDVTPLHEKYIERRGYSLQSVLPVGVSLPLIYWGGFGAGGKNKECGRDIHPALREEIERAAALTEQPLVGFDIIIEDAQKGPTEQAWGIIEANSIPWIDLHASLKLNKTVNVAAYIWDLWDAESYTQKEKPAIAGGEQ